MTEATKVTYTAPVAVDDDGTPLVHGERMTEVRPGVWMDPLAIAALEFLKGAGA